jgi:DNA-binding IclR family transcriptional regulator
LVAKTGDAFDIRQSSEDDPGIVRAVLRALRILGQIRSDGVNLTDLSSRVELPIPTVLRLVRTLEVENFVERRDGLIHLGPGVLQLAAAMDPDGVFGSTVKAAAERLRDSTNETACVYLRDGIECVAIKVAEAEQDVRWVPQPGERFPIWFGGPADVLLAFGPTDKILADLHAENKRNRWTKRDPEWADVDALREIANETRERGYAINSRDRLRGAMWRNASDVWGVSVPIYTSSDALYGALGFGAPGFRARRSDEQTLVDLALDIARMPRLAQSARQEATVTDRPSGSRRRVVGS